MDESYVDKAFGQLRSLLTDTLVEICVNPDGRVWVENRGDVFMKQSPVRLSNNEVRDAGMQIAAEGNIRLSDKHPVGSASINYREWLIRAQMVQHPVVRGGDALSMRFFKSDTEMFEPAYFGNGPQSASAIRRDLVARVSELAKTDLIGALKMCVAEKLNLVVSGGTSSGKTTIARWLVAQVDHGERIITIEDVPDLMPLQPNKVMMISNRLDPIRSPDVLLQSSLRMRPNRIILSEVTGADAYTFLKAINTGHGGSITTIHAETAELAVERMAQTALEADGKMTYQDMISYVVRSIDVIVHVGKRDGKRGVLQVFLPSQYNQSEEFLNAES
ncbi:MAG: type IV secretion system protein VirB11 [Candidatus Azotimanducaceae bacterium]|jgi:type IV secretion system protein VirB11